VAHSSQRKTSFLLTVFRKALTLGRIEEGNKMREKLLITPLTVNDDAIQVARQDVRTAFWFLWIAAAVTLCGSLLDISWLKASEAGVYFWMGAFGLALLARLIINCTDHIVAELSAVKTNASLSSIEQSVPSLESKLSSIEWSLSSIEATLKDLEGKWAGEEPARLKSISNGLAEIDERVDRQTKK
jgi:hypothetical protein